MARPREFDRDEALRRAMTLFWEHGYEATSTDDLVRAMGIGRQSMYAAFGDKHRLYLESLQLYEAESCAALSERIASTPSPLGAIRDYLLSIAEGGTCDRSRGCFFVNATTELAHSDPEVEALIQANINRGAANFANLLKKAKRLGEVDPSLDERTGANYLLATIRGLRVSAKAGLPRKDLRDIALLALSCLKPRGSL